MQFRGTIDLLPSPKTRVSSLIRYNICITEPTSVSPPGPVSLSALRRILFRLKPDAIHATEFVVRPVTGNDIATRERRVERIERI